MDQRRITEVAAAPGALVQFAVRPATCGKITGTVTGVPCSGSAGALPGATVEIDTWAASCTLTTAKDGTYALWLDNRNNALTVIVAKDGWKPQTKQVTITAKKTSTANWALKPKNKRS